MSRVEGSTVVVRKTQVSGAPSSYDWVALYAADQSDGRQFIGSYSYVATDADATTLLKLPKTPGSYVVRFFAGSSGYSPLAQSNELVVENTDKLSVALESSDAGAKQALSVVAHVDSIAAHGNNWAGVFALGTADQHNFLRYAYVPTWGVPVRLDNPSQPGQYVVRLFPRGSFKPIKESEPFTIV